MHRAMKALARLIAGLALALGLALPAAAADADSSAIRSVIQSQIDAFRQDDGAAAYGFASPGIKQIYPTVGAFMGMVRGQYQPVYRPRSLTFGALADSPFGPQQKVFLIGPGGKSWVARYTLERQPDGTWKIKGCELLPDDAPTA